MNEFICEFSIGDTDGLTIAIDDTIDVAAYPTTRSSQALAAGLPATENAEVVERLLTAGWHVIGKTTTQELAFGTSGINALSETPENPQDAQLMPGGASSGGASAVGLYLSDAAIGSDSDGAVRLPAACCGVIGMKPTFGRISRAGVAPTHTTLECIAPSSRSMLTLIDVLAAITPQFDDMLAYSSLKAIRIGIVHVAAMPEIITAVHATPALLGWQATQCDLVHFEAASLAAAAVHDSEMWHAFGHLLLGGKLSKAQDTRLRWAAETSPHDLALAQDVRTRFSAELDAALQHVDALILPSLPALPFSLTQAALATPSAVSSLASLSSFLSPFNLSGHPSLTLPLPLADSHLMAGLQIVGRKGEDEFLCALASQFETALQ